MIRVHSWYLVFCIQGTSSRHPISKINSTFQRQNHRKKWRRFGRNTDNSTMLTWPTTATTTTKRPQTPKDQLSAPAAPSAVIFKLCTSFVQKICNASTEEFTVDETALSGRHPTNLTQPPPQKAIKPHQPHPLLTPQVYRELLPRKKRYD